MLLCNWRRWFCGRDDNCYGKTMVFMKLLALHRTVTLHRINLNNLDKSSIILPPILDICLGKITNATAINPIRDPESCNCALFLLVDLNLNLSEMKNNIFNHNLTTNTMFFTRSSIGWGIHTHNLDCISTRMIGHPTCDTPLESSFHVLFVRVNKFSLVLVYRNLVSNVFRTGGVVT